MASLRDIWLYSGKLGTDNALLILTGLLFFVLFYLKRREAMYDRLWLYFWCGVFFMGYGFLDDAYRIRLLRPILLGHWRNFALWRSLILFVTLLPLYIKLTHDIAAIIIRNIRQRRKRQNPETF